MIMMKRGHALFALLFAASVTVAACGTSAPDSQATAAEPAPGTAQAAPGAQLQATASGRLTAVDADARTLTVSVGDGENAQTLVFTYDQATAIVGADGQVQALTGRDGSMVTVVYEERGISRHAVRIRIS
jgi:hypothetical protein